MQQDHKAEIDVLSPEVTLLSTSLFTLSNVENLKRLFVLIRMPGWTTLVEIIFATAIIDSMMAQVVSIQD